MSVTKCKMQKSCFEKKLIPQRFWIIYGTYKQTYIDVYAHICIRYNTLHIHIYSHTHNFIIHTYARARMYVCTYVLYGVSDCVYECVHAFVYSLLLHASTCRYVRTCVTALESKIHV